MSRTVRATLSVLAALLLGAPPLIAQEIAAPPIVVEGLRLVVSSGIDTAVTVWFRGSGLEGDTAASGQIVNAMGTLPAWLGKPVGFEILKTFALGTHLRRTYAVLLLDGGPIYFRFSYYLAPKGWVLQNLDFNTDITKIVPSTLQLP